LFDTKWFFESPILDWRRGEGLSLFAEIFTLNEQLRCFICSEITPSRVTRGNIVLDVEDGSISSELRVLSIGRETDAFCA